jgi:DNA repair exonuclease SbcCD ATPase subunit
MLNFKSIYIEGFGSLLGPFTFEIDDHGITIIKGKNGSGKTSILSALSWCCYGKTLKEKSNIEPWEHIKNEEYKGTLVKVVVETDNHILELTRCNSYQNKIYGSKGGNRVILNLDGEVQKQYRNKGDTQEAITKLLGLSFDLFRNSILFGQKMKRIIEETGPKQKQVFDEAFEVGYINRAKDNVTADYKVKQLELNISKVALNELDIKLEAAEESYKLKLKNFRDMSELSNSNIKGLEDAKDKLETKLENYKNITAKGGIKLESQKKLKKALEEKLNPNLHTRLQKLKDKGKRVAEDIESNRAVSLQFKKEKLNPLLECKECGNKLTSKGLSKHKKDLADRILQNETDFGNLEMDLKLVKADIVKVAKLVATDDKLSEEILNYNLSINSVTNTINNANTNARETLKSIQTEQKKITNAKSVKIPEKPNRAKIKNIKLKRKPHRRAIKKLTKEIDLLQWLIKDPLSNSGLKNFIFDSMLGSVNDILFSYSNILGFEVEFGINIESSRKDFYSLISKGGNIVEFEDLSGGQQQLVNIAIAFAIHELVNTTHNVNLLSLDEVFESLDEDNIEIVTELIQQKAINKAIYLITHVKSFTPPNASEIHLKLSHTGETLLV